jgi:hypothetical protein
MLLPVGKIGASRRALDWWTRHICPGLAAGSVGGGGHFPLPLARMT